MVINTKPTPFVGTLAKLTPPKFDNVVQRTRLFRQIDKLWKSHKIIWLTSPAGSGKTTLMASYFQARRMDPLWYQIDEGDRDVGSFYYYLGLGIDHASNIGSQNISHFSREFYGGEKVFSRNFFRQAFLHLKANQPCVFDNIHELGHDSELLDLLAIGISETPVNQHVVILSRSVPPECFTRLNLTGSLSELNWNDLRLTTEESEDICHLRGYLPPAQDTRLIELCDGWIAGLILLLEQNKTNTMSIDAVLSGSQQSIFDFIAVEIFKHANLEIQQLLLKTCILPSYSLNLVVEFLQIPQAEYNTKLLVKQNYFITVHPGEIEYFEYHPLFRAFLLKQLETSFSQSDLILIKQKTAQYCLLQKNYNNAIELFTQIKDWKMVLEIIQNVAQTMLNQGSTQTLIHWIDATPDEIRCKNGWLDYWRGMAELIVNPNNAKNYFSTALQIGEQQNNSVVTVLSWCGLINAYVLAWGEFITLDPLIEKISEIENRVTLLNNANVTGLFHYASFLALMYRQPDHVRMAEFEQLVWELVLTGANMEMRIQAASQLLIYHSWWSGEYKRAETLVNALQSIMTAPESPPMVQISWHTMSCGYYAVVYDKTKAQDHWAKALHLAKENGIHVWDNLILINGLLLHLPQSRSSVAASLIEQAANLCIPELKLASALYYFELSWYEIANGLDMTESVNLARIFSLDSGAPFFINMIEMHFGLILALRGEEQQGLSLIKDSRKQCLSFRAKNLVSLSYLLEAEYSLSTNRIDQCIKALSLSLKASQWYNVTWWRDDLFSRLCNIALEYQVETERVKTLIKKHDLHPIAVKPFGISERWPFPIQIKVLGMFSISLNGEVKQFGRKIPKKPLEMLKCIIAHGGKKISSERIIQALWPDIETAPRNTFDTTLYRLRQILGSDVLITEEGYLLLNPHLVRVDYFNLKDNIQSLLSSLNKQQLNEELASSTLKYLRQPLFDQESESIWALRAREELDTNWITLIHKLAEYRSNTGDSHGAISILQDGTSLYPQRELIYQELMKIYLKNKQYSDGLQVYQNCRLNLSRYLDTAPSDETEQIRALLQKHNFN